MNKTISDELLAAYAEGKVTKEERNQVRQYLAENPQELECVMIMMDEDYELTIDNKNSQTVPTNVPRGAIPNIAAAVASPLSFPKIRYSAAAFAPTQMPQMMKKSRICKNKQKDCFSKNLDDLMDEMGI